MHGHYPPPVETARAYYNSSDADNFYATIWGGEDIHIGTYEHEEDSIFEASRRTVRKILSMLTLNESSQVLDVGSGYGGPARYFVKTTGCKVDCLNISEVQIERTLRLNQQHGMTDRVKVIEGSFEEMPIENSKYDVVMSQDAILHSGNRHKVLEEIARVLKPGGEFIFTDPMQSDDCPPGVLRPVLERIHLDSMGSFGFYTKTAVAVGLETLEVLEMTDQLITHYRRVLEEIDSCYNDLLKVCSKDYLDRMKVGLKHWVESGQKGYLAWGILHFRKK
jgi:ubiquinone/menaquinone biosynthesis C-methylase UbiE